MRYVVPCHWPTLIRATTFWRTSSCWNARGFRISGTDLIARQVKVSKESSNPTYIWSKCVCVYICTYLQATLPHLGTFTNHFVEPLIVQTRFCAWFYSSFYSPSSSFSTSWSSSSWSELNHPPPRRTSPTSWSVSILGSSRLLGCPEPSWSCVPYCLLSPLRLRPCSPPCSGWGVSLSLRASPLLFSRANQEVGGLGADSQDEGEEICQLHFVQNGDKRRKEKEGLSDEDRKKVNSK